MAPDRYVSLNCNLLIRQAITITTPAIVNGTGKELDLAYSTELNRSLQCVPLGLYPLGQAYKQRALSIRYFEIQPTQTLALVHE
jgi:hypothetical protein